jgi:hypothetical protein
MVKKNIVCFFTKKVGMARPEMIELQNIKKRKGQ